MNKFDHQREKQNKRKTMQLCWLKINELCRFEKIRKTLNASLLVWYMTYKFLKTVDINFAGFKGNPLNNVANGQFTSLHAQPVNYKKQKKRKKKNRLPVYLEDKMLRTWLGQRAKLTSSHKTYPRLDYWYHVTSSKSCGKAFCLKCFNFKISEIVLCLSNIKDIGK